MGKGAGRLPRIAEEAGFRDFIFTTEPLMGNRWGGATLSDRKSPLYGGTSASGAWVRRFRPR